MVPLIPKQRSSTVINALTYHKNKYTTDTVSNSIEKTQKSGSKCVIALRFFTRNEKRSLEEQYKNCCKKSLLTFNYRTKAAALPEAEFWDVIRTKIFYSQFISTNGFYFPAPEQKCF